MLADLESLEKRKVGLEKRVKGGDKEGKQTLELIEKAISILSDGKPARMAEIDKDDEKAWRMLQLLTAKPVLYVANVDEDSAASGNDFSAKVIEHANSENAEAVIISAQIESELALLEGDERTEYLDALGLTEPGLDRLIRAGYALLGLKTYFTVGPKEARAWTFQDGWTAPKCAGVIHTDFEKGFIRAETTSYDDYVNLGGEPATREAGKVRQEGKDYVVKDGDIMLFKFNV
jgi:GTP-binding protein YchF